MEDMKLTLKDLENVFNAAIKYNEKYIGVSIQAPDSSKSEIIINSRENFEAKLSYYKKAYNDDLTKKTSNEVKITGFIYGCNFAEIQDMLNY